MYLLRFLINSGLGHPLGLVYPLGLVGPRGLADPLGLAYPLGVVKHGPSGEARCSPSAARGAGRFFFEFGGPKFNF